MNDNLDFVLGQWVHLRFTAFTPIKYQKYFTHMVGLAGMKDCGYKRGYNTYDQGYKFLLDAFDKIYIPTNSSFKYGNMVWETSHNTS